MPPTSPQRTPATLLKQAIPAPSRRLVEEADADQPGEKPADVREPRDTTSALREEAEREVAEHELEREPQDDEHRRQ